MERNPYQPPTASIKDQPEQAPPRPPQVTLAYRILWAGLIAGWVSIHPWIRGEWWLSPDGSVPPAAALAFGLVFGAIFTVVFVVFLVFTGRRHNWARWALLAFLILGWGITALELPETISATPLAALIDLVIAAAELWACYLLFLGPGARWFKREAVS